MKLAYVLNKNLNIETLAKDLQKILSKIPNQELPNTALIIDIQKINDHPNTQTTPMITYQDSDSLT